MRNAISSMAMRLADSHQLCLRHSHARSDHVLCAMLTGYFSATRSTPDVQTALDSMSRVNGLLRGRKSILPRRESRASSQVTSLERVRMSGALFLHT